MKFGRIFTGGAGGGLRLTSANCTAPVRVVSFGFCYTRVCFWWPCKSCFEMLRFLKLLGTGTVIYTFTFVLGGQASVVLGVLHLFTERICGGKCDLLFSRVLLALHFSYSHSQTQRGFPE